MKRWLHNTIFCLMILVTMPVQAKIINDLYRAQIPVNDQSADLRDQAINQGFLQVLTKVSGNSQIQNNSSIALALADASNYMQQYSYVQTPLIGQAAMSNPDATRLTLQVVFDSQQISQLLKQANQPLWGKDRPAALVWVAIDNGSGHQILGLDSQDPTVSMLQQMARQRGLPLKWPAVPQAPTATDTAQSLPQVTAGANPQPAPAQQLVTEPVTFASAITADDIWQANVQNIQHFSSAYNANVIIISRLMDDAGHWNGQWTLLVNGEQLTWQSSGDDEWSTVQQGMNDVVDAIAQRFSVQSDAQKMMLTVTVTNLDSLGGYAKAEAYLKQLTPVQDVELLQIDADSAQFNVTYQGTQNDLLKAIQLDHRLIPIQLKDSDFQSTMNYQWQ